MWGLGGFGERGEGTVLVCVFLFGGEGASVNYGRWEDIQNIVVSPHTANMNMNKHMIRMCVFPLGPP